LLSDFERRVYIEDLRSVSRSCFQVTAQSFERHRHLLLNDVLAGALSHAELVVVGHLVVEAAFHALTLSRQNTLRKRYLNSSRESGPKIATAQLLGGQSRARRLSLMKGRPSSMLMLKKL
jgi:hypothetical protein